MILTTTLNAIRRHSPCSFGWSKLLNFLGKTKADDDTLTLKTILDSNGIEDAIWCLRSVSGHDKEIRLFEVWCARQVEHLDETGVAKNTNDISEKFANGLASSGELDVACTAARDVAWAAACTAAMAAARAAARDAACIAARDVACTAAMAAACTAAMAAALAAASDAALAAASDAAWAAARECQKEEFIKRFCEE